jgi:hypothetical protein
MTLQFKEQNSVVTEAILQMKGLPKDLYSARLGKFQGSAVEDRSVSLPVLTTVAEGVGARS